MSRLVRQLLVASLLALYGSVSLCGSGLHALEDGEHGKHPLHADQSSVQPGGSSADDCPLCHYLVQGQMSVAVPPLPHPSLIQFRTTIVHRVCTCLDRFSSARPRAPPRIPARIS